MAMSLSLWPTWRAITDGWEHRGNYNEGTCNVQEGGERISDQRQAAAGREAGVNVYVEVTLWGTSVIYEPGCSNGVELLVIGDR